MQPNGQEKKRIFSIVTFKIKMNIDSVCVHSITVINLKQCCVIDFISKGKMLLIL